MGACVKIGEGMDENLMYLPTFFMHKLKVLVERLGISGRVITPSYNPFTVRYKPFTNH